MDRWRAAEREYDEWTRRPVREKTTLSERFVNGVGKPPARGNKKPDGPKL